MLVEANVVGTLARENTEILRVGTYVVFRPDGRDVIRSKFSLYSTASRTY